MSSGSQVSKGLNSYIRHRLRYLVAVKPVTNKIPENFRRLLDQLPPGNQNEAYILSAYLAENARAIPLAMRFRQVRLAQSSRTGLAFDKLVFCFSKRINGIDRIIPEYNLHYQPMSKVPLRSDEFPLNAR